MIVQTMDIKKSDLMNEVNTSYALTDKEVEELIAFLKTKQESSCLQTKISIKTLETLLEIPGLTTNINILNLTISRKLV